ncbi:NUDIX hydrolase [Jeotgalibacillus soli]|uniref:ADP-ribose pyrophosphatase n=1 Tax=Jeotgalibacillus soli TaxID=889306 RepID=A0A0C2VJU3_9BACL|nr:NUDIX hydrolase [Jeotgalibacillus soli]KIL44268.1 ADP-ribose pyrophosphatase [Jeotgalibacillus soli]
MKKFEEVTIKKDVLFEGRIINLQVEKVSLPNGKTSTREIIKHPGAVCVIALTDEGKIIMVEQYRKALERSILEIPAGKLEPGEEPILTAARELEEETGYGCQELLPLISFYTSPGFADELVHVFVAKGLYRIEEPKEVDEDEFVELFELTLEEAEVCVANQRIFDAKTAYAVQYLRLENLRENSK